MAGADRGGDKSWEAAEIKEDSKILVAITSISLDTPAAPVSFSTWSVQGPVNSVRIWSINATLLADLDEIADGLLHKITLT